MTELEIDNLEFVGIMMTPVLKTLKLDSNKFCNFKALNKTNFTMLEMISFEDNPAHLYSISRIKFQSEKAKIIL